MALTAACGGSLAAAMALAPEKNRYETRDRITHAWASGLLDLHTTTLGDNVPGVTVHAQARRRGFQPGRAASHNATRWTDKPASNAHGVKKV